MYSQKTERAIDKYFRNLVKRQPTWLKELFDTDKVVFEVTEQGDLYIQVDETIDERKKKDIAYLISQYVETHPHPMMLVTTIN